MRLIAAGLHVSFQMGDGKGTAEKEKSLTPGKMGIMKIKTKLAHCKLTIPQ